MYGLRTMIVRGFSLQSSSKCDNMSKLKVMSEEERRAMLAYLEERFGMDSKLFDGYEFVKSGRKVWITNKEVVNKNFSGMNVEAAGMLFVRWEKKDKIKLTTNGAQLFGMHAKKNVVEISEDKLHDVVCGLNLYDVECDATDGYVILKYKEHVLGIGLKQGRFIKNMIPKARRIKKL